MMMIMGRGRETFHSNPTVQIPSWDDLDHPTDHVHSPFFDESEMSLYDDVLENNETFSCDHFRMYEFKVRRCLRGRSHDWTDCPYAHPGEKARRRDPRKFHYSGTPCPEFRKGACSKNDTCEYAHGVFECWLHPSRYRTQPCKDGVHCTRRICFFAHTPEQLRLLSPPGLTQPESPSRVGLSLFGSSPTSTLYTTSFSPPMSPVSSLGRNSVSELASSIRNLHLTGSGFCSPLRPGYTSLPSTPTRNPTRTGMSAFDIWEDGVCLEEPVMERVESGKEVRAKLYAKLSRENSMAGRVDSY